MNRQYFGTDGVRGPYGGAVINEVFVGRLARAAGAFFREKSGGHLTRVVVGRDTRGSGESLGASIIAALVESGLEVCDADVVPTPAVAGAMEKLGAEMGVMITASHNPSHDNGIKFFGKGGRKLTDTDELRIEEWLQQADLPVVAGGFLRRSEVARGYMAKMQMVLPQASLQGWRIAVDAAHGATAVTTPGVLAALGADLELMGHAPDGHNINHGVGSQHPEGMVEAVLRTGAKLGIAHDGDGDRVILCDETGFILDGDDLLAILGLHALSAGKLKNDTLVATVQSNLGLDRALEAAGGKVVRTRVGDRYVIDEMLRGDFILGGESSGHVVLGDLATTGDGLATALKVIEVMMVTGKPLSQLRRCWKKFPQVSASLRVRQKTPLWDLPGFSSALTAAEARLGASGRVLVRYSGTEPILRFLVEGEDAEQNGHILRLLQTAAEVDLA